jgi:hypothetical protein
MVPKSVFIAMICTTFLAWSGVSIADEYRADQYLGQVGRHLQLEAVGRTQWPGARSLEPHLTRS